MSSTINLIGEYEDDDDGIDWSEACREIDLVCEAASNIASTSSEKPPNRIAPTGKFGKKRIGSAKQSKLDNFFVKSSPKPSPEIPDVCVRSEDKPSGVEIDPEAAKTWIYPVNVPLRDYQFAITKTALFSNTLVALPTGLGKTLIAAVVMYNYFRWFPEGKIVFAAPSRPLVMQQIEACHNIVGIPQEMTIDMTGLINPTKRACLWKSKRVFFVTPQVLEKDIQSGTCLVNHLVCLVIDEAHRALGNFASSVAVRQLMDIQVQLRILALTATPGSKQQTIQQIIDNLRISTLEYRNESDHDVSKYVHNRKIELIQVAIGHDADEINDKFSDVIRPYLKKLSDLRVLLHRDDKTLSQCELLTSREKFRQSPPPNFSNFDYSDAEGYFGLLISLCQMRNLLLSHGVRPAYEMLEGKMKLGSFARYMSRNEDLFKAKLIMQRCLSNGAPSPKISKMLEVLHDHFKTKDPVNSRVIIFSNFRGSVRDIMDALVDLGNCVRATQFIGQSSGKTLKGQSQKAQQAALEKFRTGGYNVIVATSVGEEGLDIMEVDLVICFDANVSPLRMIQRMGRTGRKNDGRVVVLACEGSEMKAYTRKQASSKTVGKHMRNGGINSFTFHPSPRMVPHIYKPEAQYVEMSIEKFVRNGKKVKDDDALMSPLLQEKLTDAESNLISKYFHPPGCFTWRPSLIVFPHFQTFPSRVHIIGHSYKTGLLIDTMQRLQGLSFDSNNGTSLIEDEVCFKKDLGVDNVGPHQEREDFLYADDSPNNMERKSSGVEVSSPTHMAETKENPSACDFSSQSSTPHTNLFGSDFVSVDSVRNVLILSVPILTHEQVSHPNNKGEKNGLDQVSWHLKIIEEKNDETFQAGADQVQIAPQTRCPAYGSPRVFLNSSAALEDKKADEFVKVSQSSTMKGNLDDEDSVVETRGDEIKTSFLLHDEDGNDFSDIDLSPRVTSMIKSGFVPESPIENNVLSNGKERNIWNAPELVSPSHGTNNIEITSCARNVTGSPINGAVQTPVLRKKISASAKSESPLLDLTNDSCSKNWCLNVGEKSESVELSRKFKRLRKVGDCEKHKNVQRVRGSSLVPGAKLPRGRGKKLVNDEIRTYIDDEAEVSSGGSVSEDEEDYQDNDSHDSFIDDRTCPTNAATQSATGTDMMAIYRRSLLSQSPMPGFPSESTTRSSHSSEAATAQTSGTESFSGKQSFSLHTPLTNSENHLSRSRDSKPSIQMNPSSETLHNNDNNNNNNNNTADVSSKTEGRKRKLSFCPSSSVPTINLEQEFQLQYDNSKMFCDDDFFVYPSSSVPTINLKQEFKLQYDNSEMFCDDDFFDDIDFDAVEAQATLLLKQKSESLTTQKQDITVPLNPQGPDLDIPSFDLGI